MAAAVSAQPVPVPSGLRIIKATVVCDTAYPTGGYDFSAILTAKNGFRGGTVFGVAQVRYSTTSHLVAVVRGDVSKVALYESTTGAPHTFTECAASSADVTASTIIDLLLLVASPTAEV